MKLDHITFAHRPLFCKSVLREGFEPARLSNSPKTIPQSPTRRDRTHVTHVTEAHRPKILYWRDFYTNKLANPSVACSSDDFFGPANVFAPGSAMKLEKEEEMGNSPVNLGIFEAQHQTNCNRIVFNAI